jgi:hypothetical protein
MRGSDHQIGAIRFGPAPCRPTIRQITLATPDADPVGLIGGQYHRREHQ